jgi:two-component system cell cycle sensor histidine kinase/response regulator CckA
MDEDVVHILLAEDEEAHAELIRRAFKSRAPSVHLTVASNLEEARTLQAKHPTDLIIADLFLPDGRGTELLPGEGVPGHFPVVIMTSHGDEQVAVEAMKAGAIDYIVKSPAIIADMPHIAERALREWRHIVERRLADEALKESEEKLRLIFERAFDGISIYEELPGRQRRLIDCNEHYAEMAGRSKGELLEITDFASIQRKLEPPRSDEENVRIRSEQLTYQGRFTWVRPDGKENIIEYSAAPTEVGERALTIGIDRDITERVRAEQALKEYSERLEAMVAERAAEVQAQYARLDAILRSVGDAIMMTDRELLIRYVNPAFTALTGYTATEALGQFATSIGAGADSEQDRQSIASALAERKTWQGEVTGRRKDGRVYDAFLTVAPVLDAQGYVTGYVSSHHDITQRKALERARSQFITNVSHQFRTPVTTLQLYTYLMRQTESPEELFQHLEAIEEQIKWLVQLIQDTLEITALDSGKAISYWQPISIPTLIEGMITRYQTRAETSNLTLTAVPAPTEMPLVEGDQSRLAQALGKIIENAIVFTPPGGQVTLELATARAEGRLWVTAGVHDTGPGISPEEQEKVFDRFFRGSLAEAGEVPGTGLGLSIAYEIVRAHGGRITVESQVGQGATFTIWLPPTEMKEQNPP